MKILFWLNGSGGQRTERKVIDFDETRYGVLGSSAVEEVLKDMLDEWRAELNCHSQVVRYGWSEKFTKDLEPLD